MAITPYVSKVSVQPVSSVNTAGIVKAGQIEAQSMLGTARVMNALGEMAYKKGAEVATIAGVESAVDHNLMRDSNDQVIAPNNLPPQDTFFNKAYYKSVVTKYTNDLQLDVSKELQDLSIKYRHDPEKFQEESTSYLKTTLESVLPAVKNDVASYSGERQRQYYASLSNKHQQRVDNQTERSTEQLIDIAHTELRNHVLAGSDDMAAYAKAHKNWMDNLEKLRPYIGPDEIEIRVKAVERSLGAMHFFSRYTDLPDIQRAEISKQIAAGKGIIFKENPTLMDLNGQERQNLALFINRYESQAKGLEAEELKINANIIATSLMTTNLKRQPLRIQQSIKDLVSKMPPKERKAFDAFPATKQLSIITSQISNLHQNENIRHRDSARELDLANKAEQKKLYKEENLYLNRALVNYKDEYKYATKFIKDYNITGEKNINSFLRSTLQFAMKENKDVVTTRLITKSKLEIKFLSKILRRDATVMLGDNWDNPDKDQLYRYLNNILIPLRKAAQDQIKLSRDLGPYINAYSHQYSLEPGKANGKYVIQALRHLGVENPEHPDTWLANMNLGIPDAGVNMMIQGTQGAGSFNPQTIERSVSLFSSYYNRGGVKHLRAQLGSKTFLQLEQISRLGNEDGFGSKEALTAVQNILKDKGDPFDQVKRNLGSEYINENGTLNTKKLDELFNSDWENANAKYVVGEGNDWMDKSLRAFSGAKYGADVAVDVSTPKELTFASAPQAFRTASRSKWMANLQAFAGDGVISDSDRQSALKSAITDTLKSQNLGSWGWTLYASPIGEHKSGDWRLRKDAVESHFWVPSPTDIGGRSTVWIKDAATEELKKQLPKNAKRPKDGYRWGTNIFLENSGKYNKQTGKPIYWVRTQNDERLDNLMFNKGKPIEIDLSPRLEEEYANGVMNIVGNEWNKRERLRNKVEVSKTHDAERQNQITGGKNKLYTGKRSNLSAPPLKLPIPSPF